ncbi:deoxyuridine 5'-triphosphate nucleotidohydrolase [Alphaproteobacteria bacterium]|nr:deoxyuridine 5'-triphosphate nucleotidohydrolase [Alphaproteobacteria bacterium]
MAMFKVPICRLPHAKDLHLPRYASAGASGLELLAAVSETAALQPGAYKVVPTGIIVGLPAGLEGQVRANRAMAENFGIIVLGGTITLDSDFRGEVKVLLQNASDKIFLIKRGQPIAQLVVAPVAHVAWQEVSNA